MTKDEKMARFGLRLRELREAKGISRKQLADGMELSERAVIQWELGEREPGWFNVLALCAALGVSCEAFTIAAKDAPAPERGRPRKASASEDKPVKSKAAPKKKRTK